MRKRPFRSVGFVFVFLAGLMQACQFHVPRSKTDLQKELFTKQGKYKCWTKGRAEWFGDLAKAVFGPPFQVDIDLDRHVPLPDGLINKCAHEEGQTLLCLALARKALDSNSGMSILKALLRSGAKLLGPCSKAFKGHEKDIPLFQQRDVVIQKLRGLSDTNGQGWIARWRDPHNGGTILHLIAKCFTSLDGCLTNCIEDIDILIKVGVDPFAKDNDGNIYQYYLAMRELNLKHAKEQQVSRQHLRLDREKRRRERQKSEQVSSGSLLVKKRSLPQDHSSFKLTLLGCAIESSKRLKKVPAHRIETIAGGITIKAPRSVWKTDLPKIKSKEVRKYGAFRVRHFGSSGLDQAGKWIDLKSQETFASKEVEESKYEDLTGETLPKPLNLTIPEDWDSDENWSPGSQSSDGSFRMDSPVDELDFLSGVEDSFTAKIAPHFAGTGLLSPVSPTGSERWESESLSSISSSPEKGIAIPKMTGDELEGLFLGSAVLA